MPARRQSGTGAIDPATGLPIEGGRGRGKEGKEKETFACPHPGCGQTYSRMEYMKRHQRKHQDDRPFQCKDCIKAFARSDVLLRHRRRCHPTPPPADRNSHSPPAPHRSYPGVPISSSRTDARDASPAQPRARKHPRQSSGDEERNTARARIDPSLDPQLEEEFDREADEEPFGEDGRFGRHNGMGNGGVYSATSSFYGTTGVPEGSTYTPHLLPMFQQQNQQFHSVSDPDHLEDASVLLSMAYPGGVPAGENPDLQRDLPDWANNPTINMMMEAAVAANREQEEAAQRGGNSEAITIPETIAAVTSLPVANGTTESNTLQGQNQGQPDTLVDPSLTAGPEILEGNFLNTMSWLSGMGSEGMHLFSGMNAASTASTPRPNSPFPLAQLFSPSAFGITLPNANDNNANTDSEVQPPSPSVMAFLTQLAMHEVPATINNPNPERPLLRLASAEMLTRAGTEWFDKSSPFYLPAERFAGCYEIPHWGLPPLRTLSVMACRTFHTVLNHFSFLHMPTFRLTDTAACLAFAICTIGGIRTDSFTAADDLVFQAMGISNPQKQSLDGPVVPDQSWESLYEANWNKDKDDKQIDAQKVKRWDKGTVVRAEKTGMLVKSFSLAQGVLMTEYNVALLQSLILYHAPNFLSSNESERVMANMFLGTIVHITRQVGFYTPEADHISLKIRTPVQPFTPNELDRAWREWIQMETRRRTAYLVYQLDTVSALESNIPCILSSCELSYIPLPAPDSLWKAPTAQDWYKAVKKYHPMNLDEAMRRIFYLPTFGPFDTLHENADTKHYNLLNVTDLGPFARSAMVLTLLRGVIDIGEGKRDRGDWRDLTDLWVGCSWLRPGKRMVNQDGKDLGAITRESLRGRFAQGLQKWREGWDFDKLCSSPGQNISRLPTESVSPQSAESSSPPGKSEPELPKETFNYCEDALPFYWLALALLNHLNNSPPREPGFNAFSGIRYSDMLKSARTFTRMGEGVPGATGYGASPSTARQSSTSVNDQDPSHRLSFSGSASGAGSVPGSTSTSGSSISPDFPNSIPSDTHIEPNVNLDFGSGGGFDIPAMSPGTMEGIMEALGASSSSNPEGPTMSSVYEAFTMGLGGVPISVAEGDNAHTQGKSSPNQPTQGNFNSGNGAGGGDGRSALGGGIVPTGSLAEQIGFII
ncbi:hypothetical protein I316_05252 [Kwoniella heveanensis BCC8398]|uniref:C2H2-type domain-containing protein n=1 Tax=Kwoniella heveanensis BCC8398 TaxID=1296120 RepID=A0A1B9GQC6_9TREE|nr:hypothetical protein I316_05252 [Kwoniella heveanensis BCC8398]